MDWLKGMNCVVEYIEDHLTENIKYDLLARIVGCSVYEFSRIFSFMTGMSISEYIRRRRLSQAVFDIQNSDEKIIDIALRYGYESQSTFSRAFKELHHQTPMSARKNGVPLKTYPKIAFKLTIKGVIEMNFRIENKDGFKIIGLKGNDGNTLDWRNFMDNYNNRLKNGGGAKSYYKAPFWQVGAYKFDTLDGKNECILGAELRDEPLLDGMDVETISAATWAVFTITSKSGTKEAGEAYTRILSEWFPVSDYRRNASVQSLEVYGPGNASSPDYQWEIWMPVLNK